MSHRCVHPKSVVKMSPTCTLLHHLVQRVSVVDNIGLFTWGSISNAYTQRSVLPTCTLLHHLVQRVTLGDNTCVFTRGCFANPYTQGLWRIICLHHTEGLWQTGRKFPNAYNGPAFTGIYLSTRTLAENNYSSLKNTTTWCWTTIPYTSCYRFRITYRRITNAYIE